MGISIDEHIENARKDERRKVVEEIRNRIFNERPCLMNEEILKILTEVEEAR